MLNSRVIFYLNFIKKNLQTVRELGHSMNDHVQISVECLHDFENGCNYDYLLKFITIGDYGVGKTSIVQKFIHHDQYFDEDAKATIGIDFGSMLLKSNLIKTKDPTIKTGENLYKMHIWDCGGQSRYKSIIKPYFRDSNAVLLVFDLTDRKSFEHLKEWRDLLLKNTSEKDRYELIVVGNKSDHINGREVKWIDANSYAKLIGAHYIEVSAKKGVGIHKLFSKLISEIDWKVRNGLIQTAKRNVIKDLSDVESQTVKPQTVGCCVIT